LTASICNEYNSILESENTIKNTVCYWTGTFCRNIACRDAPVTHDSDLLCNTFLDV